MIAARRYLALLVWLILLAPILAMPFLPFQAISKAENRALAPAPAWPATVEAWRKAPREIDAFLGDHFGFRPQLLRVAQKLSRLTGGETGAAAAVAGKDGWMFLTDGLLLSTGQESDLKQVADYADYVCAVDARLKAQGVRMVFSLAPSPAEIYPEKAPEWAGPTQRTTEYDRILAAVGRCGVAEVDLRPTLRAHKGDGLLYRKLDSHWSLRGSLLAYNRMVEVMGRPEWRTAPEALHWNTVELENGDLPRLAAQAAQMEAVEIHERTELPPGMARRPLEGLRFNDAKPYIVETGKPGPTVLVIGDSYTENPFAPYFAPFAGRVAWAHQDGCGFDWEIIDRVKPDVVLLLPVARNAVCWGRRPVGFALPAH